MQHSSGANNALYIQPSANEHGFHRTGQTVKLFVYSLWMIHGSDFTFQKRHQSGLQFSFDLTNKVIRMKIKVVLF